MNACATNELPNFKLSHTLAPKQKTPGQQRCCWFRVLLLILPGDCAVTLVESRLPELRLAEEQHWELPVRTSRALPEQPARETAERP